MVFVIAMFYTFFMKSKAGVPIRLQFAKGLQDTFTAHNRTGPTNRLFFEMQLHL